MIDRNENERATEVTPLDGGTAGRPFTTAPNSNTAHDPSECPCNEDTFGNGPCADCRDEFAHRRIEERLRRYTQVMPNGCWEWTGARARKGYGVIQVNGRQEKAHRVAWKTANRTFIPTGLFVLHSCDNPPCINPAHLRLGTQLENMREMAAKGRTRHDPDYCHNGHRLDEDNNRRILPSGARTCRACCRATAVRFRRRRQMGRKPSVELLALIRETEAQGWEDVPPWRLGVDPIYDDENDQPDDVS